MDDVTQTGGQTGSVQDIRCVPMMLLDQVCMNHFTPIIFPTTLAVLCPSHGIANLLGELTILYVDNI